MRQPVDRVADHLDVGHGRRDRGPDPVDQRATAGPPRPRPRPPPPAATRPPPRPAAADDRPAARLAGRNRTPARTASSPTPGGPPHLCALAVSTDQPVGYGHPADRLGGVDQQRHAGRGARLRRPPRPAAPCRPRGWRSSARPRRPPRPRPPSANASRSTRPSRSTGTGTARPPAACVRRGRVQHGRVLHRRVHERVARPVAGPRAGRRRPRWQASVPLGREGQLLRPYPEDLGGRGPGRVEQLAGPAGLRVELARVGPAVVQRGGQRLARDRVQRGGAGRVEVGRRGRRSAWRSRAGHRHVTVPSAVNGARADTPTPRPCSGGHGRVVCDRRQDDLGRGRAGPQVAAALTRRQEHVVATGSQVPAAAVRRARRLAGSPVRPLGVRCHARAAERLLGRRGVRLRLAAGRHHPAEPADVRPVDRVGDRRARGRRLRVGPDLLVHHPLPQARRRAARRRPGTTCRSR